METFNQLIQSETPVLVDFYADWCGPCKAMSPVIKEVADAVKGKARIVKVNIDRNTTAPVQFQVQAVPTFILFKRGQVLWRQPGMIDKTSLISIIERHA
jgi:thioredoxin 1